MDSDGPYQMDGDHPLMQRMMKEITKGFIFYFDCQTPAPKMEQTLPWKTFSEGPNQLLGLPMQSDSFMGIPELGNDIRLYEYGLEFEIRLC